MVIGGVTITLSNIVDFIILLGALCVAIYQIWNFFAKPTSKIKTRVRQKRKDEIIVVLKEVLPEELKGHDLEVRDRYKADRQRYLQEIKAEVLAAIGGGVSKNKEELEALMISQRDVLREKIMRIYHIYKKDRAFPLYEQEALKQYYKDYKRLNGNSYIDKYYGRMEGWKIIYDDYDDEQ